MSEETELRGENAARSILKRPRFYAARGPFGPKTAENRKTPKFSGLCGPLCGPHREKTWNFGWSEIGVAGRSERRHMDRLKGNGETESLKMPKLVTNSQKQPTTNNHQPPTTNILLLLLLKQ